MTCQDNGQSYKLFQFLELVPNHQLNVVDMLLKLKKKQKKNFFFFNFLPPSISKKNLYCIYFTYMNSVWMASAISTQNN